MRNVKVLAKDKAKTLLDETVNRLKRYFQREMLHILVEFDTVRETVIKRDKELKLVARRLIDQEDDIVLKNTRLLSSALIEASRELRTLKLEHIDELENESSTPKVGQQHGGLQKVPLSDRVDGHYEKVARFGGTYEESDQVKLEVPKVMHRAFNFYGAYVSLSQKERDKYAREQMLTYYRDCVCELEDKNRVLEQSIDILKDLNMKYSNELTSLRDRVAVAESQNHRLAQENRETLKKFEEAERNLKDAAAYERKRLEEELGIEKQMLRDELRVNEALNK